MENKFKLKNIILVTVIFFCYEIGSFYYKGYLAEQELLSVPTFKLIKKHYPLEYEELLRVAAMVKRNETSLEYFENHVKLTITPVYRELQSQSPYYASEDEIFKYYETLKKITESLNPESCYNFFKPNVDKKSKYLNEELKVEFLEVQSEIFNSLYSSIKKVEIINEEVMKSEIQKTIIKIAKEDQKFNLDGFNKTEPSNFEMEQMCLFYNKLYTVMLDNNQVDLLRYNLVNPL